MQDKAINDLVSSLEPEEKIIFDALADIRKKSKTNGIIENCRFYEYEDKSVIGKKIYNSFMEQYSEGLGFPLSEGVSEKDNYGIISNIMALSTILELESMGVEITDSYDKFCFLIECVFNDTYQGNYTAQPYYINDKNNVLNTFVETAAKICIIANDLRIYSIKQLAKGETFLPNSQFITIKSNSGSKIINNYKDLMRLCEERLIESIDFLVKSCLPSKSKDPASIPKFTLGDIVVERDKLDPTMNYRGWAMCKPRNVEEANSFSTSIYFTYHSTNAFVSLYNTCENAFKELFSDDTSTESISASKLSIDDLLKNTYDVEKLQDKLDIKLIKSNEELFKEFRNAVSSSARYIDRLLDDKNIDISFDYVKSGFGSVSATQVINETLDGNAVMNTLFILGIFINSGLDEDYLKANRSLQYDNKFQNALNNIKKIYNILKAENEQDKIDSFNLANSINSDKHPSSYNELYQNFRLQCNQKKVYDLVPLLCNTYAILSSYSIRYPQREWIENLMLIMQNRAKDDKWIWGTNTGVDVSFNVNNNMYYVLALENFYEYHKKEEAPLCPNPQKYQQYVDEEKAVVEKELKSKSQENDKLVKELEEKTQECHDLQNRQSDLDKAVLDLVKNTFDNLFNESIERYLGEKVKDCLGLLFQAVTDYSIGKPEIKEQFDNNEGLKLLFTISKLSSIAKHLGSANSNNLNTVSIEAIASDLWQSTQNNPKS